MNVFITSRLSVVFDSDFNKVVQRPSAPFVYTKDIPRFMELKKEYNKKVKRGKIKLKGKGVPANYKPYYTLDFIEIERCGPCNGNGCALCYDQGWETVKR